MVYTLHSTGRHNKDYIKVDVRYWCTSKNSCKKEDAKHIAKTTEYSAFGSYRGNNISQMKVLHSDEVDSSDFRISKGPYFSGTPFSVIIISEVNKDRCSMPSLLVVNGICVWYKMGMK